MMGRLYKMELMQTGSFLCALGGKGKYNCWI